MASQTQHTLASCLSLALDLGELQSGQKRSRKDLDRKKKQSVHKRQYNIFFISRITLVHSVRTHSTVPRAGGKPDSTFHTCTLYTRLLKDVMVLRNLL